VSQTPGDTITAKHTLSVDLVPLYNVFFDSRNQTQFGAEWDYRISDVDFLSLYCHFGQYDNYNFYKYYDFFSEETGLYFSRQKVKVSGFHIVPGYNRVVFQIRNEGNEIFAGLLSDFSFYKKTKETYNSLSGSQSAYTYYQTRLGIGPTIGVRSKISGRITIELKSAFATRLFMRLTETDQVPITAKNGLWTSRNGLFWWTGNIKIGYVFN
jgi:hypothetical protein